MPLVPATLRFDANGTPWSERYGDVYHAQQGGPAQARHVFLGGNALPERWRGRERFVILETGFGLGLNFLTTWAAWREAGRPCMLHFVSVEAHPFSREDLRRGEALWPEFAPLAAELQANWPELVPGIHRIALEEGRLVLTLVLGDARKTLRRLMLEADAIYLDGFSPDKNPEMWSPEICHALARLAAPGATLATWSVNGALRQALAGHEFALEKQPGFAGKRHMLAGRYQSRKPVRYKVVPPENREAVVLGAGIAGSSVAFALAARGWQVTVLERQPQAGMGASGNLAGVMRPLPSTDDNFLARLTRAGFLAALNHLKTVSDRGLSARYGTPGAFHLARDKAHETVQAGIERQRLPAEFVRFLDRETASKLLGWPLPLGGWFFPKGGWAQPFSLCRANLAAFPERIRALTGREVAGFAREHEMWQVFDAEGKILAAAPHLIVAGGVDSVRFPHLVWLPQRRARGQVTWLSADCLPALRPLVCGRGYLTPEVDGIRVAGASFQLDDDDETLRLADQEENLAKLDLLLPGFAARHPVDAATLLPGRVGFRPMSPDRLPIVGAVPVPNAPNARHPTIHPGLWCLQGYGSRGIVWSALMADYLASLMAGEPLPLEYDLVRAVSINRFC
ncbi:MAG: bifunctional tRNA (5-methylaminomethyl-2-thiouridine)(34)-methyltransferase MnmD/FAD-dependent 5-carboxymethylaminomethyl-2-thiouridine(34) oxidoreductase MnmC [Zoogloeaceae bacterium]|jgi:tRNA 5-methylaminomethyl-2-thiouridine biosynthesis bifunctional protein|nr:bifunctional tRNA (5-methylaminomethyl-2-thiouridine)(34)-methyltransferase MnmD/FAD-dependent 5-carboxymethylaminomethyl-2-thiouridine(34) oxidoreductase MnmC [Zoogloeaceae bacterium]